MSRAKGSRMTLLKKLSTSGRVDNLLLRPTRETGFVKSSTGELQLAFSGPVGDCHRGETRKSDSRTLATYKRGIDIRNVRQLTILAQEELDDIAKALGIPKVEASWFGANMVFSGIPDLSLLPPSTRLQFPSNATIVVDMENYPCSQIAEVVGQHHPEVQKQVVKMAMHKRGVTAWVEREGVVKLGDTVSLFIPPQRIYPHSA
jgi:hypothetical protein